MSQTDYDFMKEFYKKEFDLPNELVDVLSVSDIMLMCVSGAGNESISSLLNIDVDYVSEVLKTTLDFQGWEEDLDVNPYKIFSSLRVNKDFTFEDFSNLILRDTNSKVDQERLNLLFRICSVFSELEIRLDSEWI